MPAVNEVYLQGIDSSKMDAKLLEKIEELTLYIIEQNTEIKNMQEEIKLLKKSKNDRDKKQFCKFYVQKQKGSTILF